MKRNTAKLPTYRFRRGQRVTMTRGLSLGGNIETGKVIECRRVKHEFGKRTLYTNLYTLAMDSNQAWVTNIRRYMTEAELTRRVEAVARNERKAA